MAFITYAMKYDGANKQVNFFYCCSNRFIFILQTHTKTFPFMCMVETKTVYIYPGQKYIKEHFLWRDHVLSLTIIFAVVESTTQIIEFDQALEQDGHSSRRSRNVTFLETPFASNRTKRSGDWRAKWSSRPNAVPPFTTAQPAPSPRSATHSVVVTPPLPPKKIKLTTHEVPPDTPALVLHKGSLQQPIFQNALRKQQPAIQ